MLYLGEVSPSSFFFRAVTVEYYVAVERSATDLEQCFVILDTPDDFGGNAHRGTR